MKWITMQLRRMRDEGLANRLVALISKVMRLISPRLISFINAHPRLRHRLIAISHSVGLYGPLKSVYHRYVSQASLNPAPYRESIYEQQDIDSEAATVGSAEPSKSLVPPFLNPHARSIYTSLSAAILKDGKGRN